MRPVKLSRVTQPFADPGGYASDPDRHGPAGHHTGTDYGSLWPIPIWLQPARAILPGRVVISEYNTTMGHWVGVYNRRRNLLVTYWHLQSRAVQVGQRVGVFDRLGRVGNSGNSTAPHLHLQVNRGSEFDYDGHIHPRFALRVFSRAEAKARWKRRNRK